MTEQDRYAHFGPFGRTWGRFIDKGIPQLFTWVEWAAVAGLVKYVGMTRHVILVEAIGKLLVWLVGVAAATKFGQLYADIEFIQRLPKWQQTLWRINGALVTFIVVGLGLTALIDALGQAATK